MQKRSTHSWRIIVVIAMALAVYAVAKPTGRRPLQAPEPQAFAGGTGATSALVLSE
jgi:hypothetical protein